MGLGSNNIPSIRFPEFERGWYPIKLGNKCLKIGSGVTPHGGAQVYQTSGIPLIRSQNINHNQLQLSGVAYISEDINKKMLGSEVKPFDVLLNITGASIGRSCVVPAKFERGNVNQHVCIIRLNGELNPFFIQILFSSSKG